MADNDPTKFFFVEFSANNKGVITTDLNADETKVRLAEEFNELYGENNWEVIEFREATEDDINQYNAWFDTMLAALEMPDESELN